MFRGDSFDGLSDKQKYVLKNGISDLVMEVCPVCGEEIGYEDMQLAIIFNGKCSLCQYRWDQIENE